MTAKFIIFVALTVTISLCNGRHVHDDQRRENIHDFHGHSPKTDSNVQLNQHHSEKVQIQGNQREEDRTTSPGINEDVNMAQIENHPLEQYTYDNLNDYVNMDIRRYKHRDQMYWNKIKGRKMQLRGSDESVDSDESLEIKSVPIIEHHNSAENTGKGRQVVNHSRPRYQQTTVEKDSREVYNNVNAD